LKKVCVIGTGYVGLVSGACFEHLGHAVICVDNDAQKVDKLKSGYCPIYEEGLEELLQKATHLTFATDLKEAQEKSEIIFICVGTPEKEDGNADLSFVFEVCRQIGEHLKENQTIVIKSTLPITAVPEIRQLLDKSGVTYNLVSNPEFLAQGTAVKDFLQPDRVVIGSDNEAGFNQVAALYEKIEAPVIRTDIASAIMIKYASNTFLATKISFINSIARLCEKAGANVKDVAAGMGYDKRIGNRFLNAGIGYGGSCFAKDTKALLKTAEKFGLSLDLLQAVEAVNVTQRQIVVEKLKHHLGKLEGKQICLLGLAFKPGTDDLRDAPALYLAGDLLNFNSRLKAYDPIVKHVKGFDGLLEVKEEPYEAVKNADAIVFVTEHPQFTKLDFDKIKTLVKGNIIIDARNFLDADEIKSLGFIYEGIGL